MKKGICQKIPRQLPGLAGGPRARSPPPAAAAAAAGEASRPPSRPNAPLPAQPFPRAEGFPAGSAAAAGGEKDGARRDATGARPAEGRRARGAYRFTPGTLQRGAGVSDRRCSLVPGAWRSGGGRRAAPSTTKRAAEPSSPSPFSPPSWGEQGPSGRTCRNNPLPEESGGKERNKGASAKRLAHGGPGNR